MMTDQEKKELENLCKITYGDSLYLIHYQTKTSVGRMVFYYWKYMASLRFRQRIEKALRDESITAVARTVITAQDWKENYLDKPLPIRVIPSSIEWENI